jgi:hypothetical protein
MPNSPNDSSLRYVQADLSNVDHQDAVLAMVDAYSRDPMGDGAPLAAEVRERLIPRPKMGSARKWGRKWGLTPSDSPIWHFVHEPNN